MLLLTPPRLPMNAPLVKAQPGENNRYGERPAPDTEPVGREVTEEVRPREEERCPDEGADDDRRDEAPER